MVYNCTSGFWHLPFSWQGCVLEFCPIAYLLDNSVSPASHLKTLGPPTHKSETTYQGCFGYIVKKTICNLNIIKYEFNSLKEIFYLLIHSQHWARLKPGNQKSIQAAGTQIPIAYYFPGCTWMSNKVESKWSWGPLVVGTVGYATKCNASIPSENQFKSWLCHFWSSSLWMHLRRQQKLVQVLGFLPTVLETRMKFQIPGLCLAQCWPCATIWGVDQKIGDFSLHLLPSLPFPLSFSLLFFQINNSKKCGAKTSIRPSKIWVFFVKS